MLVGFTAGVTMGVEGPADPSRRPGVFSRVQAGFAASDRCCFGLVKRSLPRALQMGRVLYVH